MASLAGISPGLHSSSSSINTCLSIGGSRVVVAVVTLTDLTCPLESGCTSTTRAMFQSFLGARSSTISTRSPFSKFLRGRFHFTVVYFGRTPFSISTKRHSKDTAHVSIFYGGTICFLEVSRWRHDDPWLHSQYVIWCAEWIPILGIARRDSEWPTVDDARYLSQQGSEGLIVDGLAVFSHQSRQNWSDRPYLALPQARHMGRCRRILLPLDNLISIEVSARTPLDCVMVQLI